jgi:membrane-bound serine protease (ClpP class)
MRGRNADWAEKAVRQAASLSASAAAEENVIDFVAEDIGALLDEADGRSVTVLGRDRVLRTVSATVEHVEAGAITRLLGVLSNPNLALVLMMIGIYGLIFEFMSPGMVGPGVIGAICLTVGLYSLNQLPLDYAGLALIGLGVAFMVAEAVSPSFGVLGFGGLIAFVLGSAMLIDTDVPHFQISWWLIGAMAAVSGGILVLLLGVSWRAYRRAPASVSPMLGLDAEVSDWSAGRGHVFAAGERWNAIGPADLLEGERVRVEAIDGLTLTVRRAGPDARIAEGSEGWSR